MTRRTLAEETAEFTARRRQIGRAIAAEARIIRDSTIIPVIEILQTINQHAGPAAVGFFVLTGLPILIIMAPVLITLALIGMAVLKLTRTRPPGRRPLE